MKNAFQVLPSAEQGELSLKPYDYWINPGGDTAAKFYRRSDSYLVRFPDQADFLIREEDLAVRCIPVPGLPLPVVHSLYQNSIRPIVGNHQGELYLHGSAVAIGDVAIAFTAPSRHGKTTLAGAFAKAGYPFLSEDVIQLVPENSGLLLVPQEAQLRLLPDSASYLLGRANGAQHEEGTKSVIEANHELVHCDRPLPLRWIFSLGESSELQLTHLSQSAGIAKLLQQSFILDVEDKGRLRAHFQRLAQLARTIPCCELSYRRNYDEIPHVIAAITSLVKGEQK